MHACIHHNTQEAHITHINICTYQSNCEAHAPGNRHDEPKRQGQQFIAIFYYNLPTVVVVIVVVVLVAVVVVIIVGMLVVVVVADKDNNCDK
jgi:ABC-type nickel/cobalt efflux system permease component RcnA